ncbi:hypothetical protein ACQKKG_01055 [Brevundimonas sp. NPDC003935]|jgi:hypothetical protein|uniref:hypothetical protein n=1 Tax=unclassified Brevundimonas TaxID=2622653 RepID=UPI002898D065|nr:hypothetical protein [Brevundimonas sp.]
MKVRSLIAALGCALAVSGCASSGQLVGTAADGTPVYGRSFTPTERDGAVTLNCAVGDDRRLADCRIVSERPEGKGFGAIALASASKPEARLRGNSRAGSRVEFTLRFRED